MSREARTEVRLSWHYLRRRAEARAVEIRLWQRKSAPRPENSPTERQIALNKLELLGITADTEILTRKRGKWDARYDVLALKERHATGGPARASFA